MWNKITKSEGKDWNKFNVITKMNYFLLKEDSGYLLLENGGRIILYDEDINNSISWNKITKSVGII